ncbi:MAG: hypothetical protein NVS1B7_3040 [Candidatus Saccharimonadales bacterium]
MEDGDVTPDNEERKTPRRRWMAERMADNGFFARWQRDRLFEETAANEGERDDDDDESDESPAERKSNRLSKLVRGLFSVRKLIVKEDIKTDSTSESTPRVLDAERTEHIVLDQTANELHIDHDTPSDPLEPAAATMATIEMSTAAEEKQPQAISNNELLNDESLDETVVAPLANDLPSDKFHENASKTEGQTPHELQSAQPADTITEPVLVEVLDAPGIKSSPNIVPASYSEQTEPSKSVEYTTTAGRRGNGLAGLALIGLGAEYFGRKRAGRKQEKSFSKKLESLTKITNKKNRQLATSVDQLTDQQKTERNQINYLERQVDRRLSRPFSSKETDSQIKIAPLEKADVPVVTYGLEKQVPLAAAPREKTALIVEKKEAGMSKEPLKSSNHVETERIAAADLQELRPVQEQPIEQVYERRHEVKDEVISQTVQAVAIGSVIARQQAVANHMKAAKSLDLDDLSEKDKTSVRKQPELYKQAVTMGLVGAVLIIIVGCMMYVMTY